MRSVKVQLLDLWHDIELVENDVVGYSNLRKEEVHRKESRILSLQAALLTPQSLALQIFYEKLTNFGSLGLPSGPIPFFANLPSVKILLASSKLTLLFFMIFWISCLESMSSPERESPAATLAERSKAEEEKPDSISALKEVGRRE